MTEANVYQPPRASPTTLGMVILLHGAVLGALVLAKMEMPQKPDFKPIDTYPVRQKPIPEPNPPEDVKPAPNQRVETVERMIETPPPPEQEVFTRPEPTPREAEPTRLATVVESPPERQIVATPVRREARIDPRSELKPPYPASEQRMGTEGVVTIRVFIGADGKVKSTEKMRATNDIFYQATVRHALRNWRFKPATLDGRPIESSKVMTLHFELNDDA
jgi:protein TonB